MLTKGKYFTPFLLLLFLLAACGKNKDGTVPAEDDPSLNATEPSSTKIEEPTDSMPTASSKVTIEQLLVRWHGEMKPVQPVDPSEYANFEEECQDYTFGYDDYRNYGRGQAFNENILYAGKTITGDQRVYCFDLETRECYPLCSKPECLHNSKNCNAYVGFYWLTLYQDRLIVFDAKNISYLRLDGTGGEQIQSIEPSFGAVLRHGFNAREIITHRGYVYTWQTYQSSDGCYEVFLRVPVDGGEKEILWEHSKPFLPEEKDHLYSSDMYYGIGSKVYFSICHSETEMNKLYCYDTEKDEVSLYYEPQEITRGFYPMNGKWYYKASTGICSWEPKTGIVHSVYTYPGDFFQDVVSHTCFYPNGFILPNEKEKNSGEAHSIDFYDWEGSLIRKMEVPFAPVTGKWRTFGTYENYFTCTYIAIDQEEYSVAVLDTSRLEDPSLEWMIFDFPDYGKIPHS